MSSPQLKQISAPYGVNLEVSDRGSGKPVLVLHEGTGLVADAPYLDLLAENHRVIAPSHPGFDGSSRPADFDTVDDLAYFYLELLEQFGIDDCALIGCSFGGWIAAELAVRAPRLFSKLVLVDAFGIRVATEPKTRDIADIWALNYPELGARSARDPAVRKRLFGFADMTDEQAVSWTRNNDTLALYGWQPYLNSPKLKSRLGRIRAKTLVIWGAHDGIVDPAYGRAFALAIPGARFELFSEAAHLPHLESPAEFARTVDQFLMAD